MASKAAKKLTQLLSIIPNHEQIRAILFALEGHDSQFADYAIATTGAMILERTLAVALRARFVNLTDDESDAIFLYEKRGPLSDLSSKIKLAYALNVFGPKTKQDLDHVRAIRNAFAHPNTFIGFHTPEIADICNLLHAPSRTSLISSFGSSARGKYLDSTVGIAELIRSGIRKQVVVQPKGTIGSLLRLDLLP